MISLTTKAEIQRSNQNRKTKKQTPNEQENSPEALDEMEARNLAGREIRVVIIRILNSMKIRYRNHKKGPVKNKECNI